MNLIEYLLVKLSEELVETAKPAAKAIVFGLFTKNPTTLNTNVEELSYEFMDVLVILYYLKALGIDLVPGVKYQFTDEQSQLYFHNKIVRVHHYLFVSFGLGRVSIDEKQGGILQNLVDDARNRLSEISHDKELQP